MRVKYTSWRAWKRAVKETESYLNRRRLSIIKELRRRLRLRTGNWTLWSPVQRPYGLLLTGGSRGCGLPKTTSHSIHSRSFRAICCTETDNSKEQYTQKTHRKLFLRQTSWPSLRQKRAKADSYRKPKQILRECVYVIVHSCSTEQFNPPDNRYC